MDFTRIDIKPYQLSPLLATPRSLALFFAGMTAYIAFIDPNVRNALQLVRHRLKQWKISYKNSKNILGALSLIGSACGIAAYFKTKVNLWLVGSALIGSIIPYSLFLNESVHQYLLDLDERSDLKVQIQDREKLKVLDQLKSWENSKKIKFALSLLAIGVFYLAQLQSTEDVNVGVMIS